VGLAFGIKALVGWAQGPTSWEAMSKEVSRDYGGLKVSDKTAAGFFGQYGISESEAWADRKPLTSSPAFIQFMYQQAQEQGKLGLYLASLGKMATGSGIADYLTPFKKGLQSGDYSALDALWASNPWVAKNNLGSKVAGGLGSLYLPSASGMGATTAQVAKGPTTVTVRTGDSPLVINIYGGGHDLVSRVRNEVIPIIIEHLDRGNTGLREAVSRSVRITQGAY
jgi:hypothetical protein